MEYLIDLATFSVEASSEEDAYAKARKMINDDPSWAEICAVSPNVRPAHGTL
jgi:hypothetical protein